MGTSSSGQGAGGGNPLIPSWIDQGNLPMPILQTPEAKEETEKPIPVNELPAIQTLGQNGEVPASPKTEIIIPSEPSIKLTNRYTAPKKQFNKYTRSLGRDTASLKKALKTYSRTASGNTSALARRMQPSGARVALFIDTVDYIRERGVKTTLTEFNLSQYVNRPLLDTLSALGDLIFKDTGKIYEDTQDDSITKAAYANTVTRICESSPEMDLDNLTDEQTEVMIAIFIEETIAQRVINDIGIKYTEQITDIETLLEIENGIYQIINGMVRNQIMPEISSAHRGDKQNIEQNIENIYRTAFDVMAGINN